MTLLGLELLVELIDLGEGSFFRCEHGGAALEVIVFCQLIILVGKIILGIKLIFQIILEELFLPVDTVVHGELVELIELDESESESIESSLKGIFLPVLEFDTKNMFDKLKEIIIRKLVVLLSEHVPHLSLEIWLCLELGGDLVTEVAVSQVLPPVLGENVLVLGSHFSMLGDDIFCLDDGGLPDLTLVVFEVDLLSALSLEVKVEPFQELSGEDQ